MNNLDLKKEITARWDNSAPGYDGQYAHGIKTAGERQAWLKLLQGELGTPAKKVLDVGTGTGFLAILAASLGYYCLGIDLSEEMLRKAREKAKAYREWVAFDIGDAESLAYPDNTFDVVMSRHLLWTLPHPEKALGECYRVIKPGGKVIIINAVWSTFGLSNRLISTMGKLLIAIQERKNPWIRSYKKMLGGHLPLYDGVCPGMIKDLLTRTGFREVTIVGMTEITSAESAAMPLRYRLAYRHERYTVTGLK
jgi:ubiquinone/menaquinone biosynthesis C-methylase UbiE